MLQFFLQWLDEGTLAQQIFRIVALIGLLMAILRMILNVIGIDSDTDFEAAMDDGGGHVLSWNTIAGFALGFGAVGSIMISQGYTVPIASLAGCAAGFAIGTGFYFMMRLFHSLKEDNTFRIESCLNATGTVYVRIPAGQTGGQIQILAQSRYVTLSALADEDLQSGTPIRVTSVLGPELVKVERLQ